MAGLYRGGTALVNGWSDLSAPENGRRLAVIPPITPRQAQNVLRSYYGIQNR
jgi:hypothetical protein